MPTLFSRLLAALPDSLSAGVFLFAWVAPRVAGAPRIKGLLLTMLIEFLVIHSSAFYVQIESNTKISRRRRSLMLAGTSLIYLLFVFGFSLAFDSTWPIWVFAWLLGSRFLHLWITPPQTAAAHARVSNLWAISVMTYVLGIVATVILPIPALGITPDVIAWLHLPGTGDWISRPYTVLAFGTLYFSVQAWAKFSLSRSAST